MQETVQCPKWLWSLPYDKGVSLIPLIVLLSYPQKLNHKVWLSSSREVVAQTVL